MTHYDVTVITRNKEALEKVAGLLQAKNVPIISRSEIGERQFAHPIAKQRSGFYGTFIVDLAASRLADLQSTLNLSEDIMRSLVVQYAPVAISKASFESEPVVTPAEPQTEMMVAEPLQQLPVEAEPMVSEPTVAEKPQKAVAAVKEKKTKPPKQVGELSEKERLKMLDEKLKKLLEE
ncbi:30S ribosomal protein S6 [Candidatus Berkelbacteria bacterium]|nr:30S ribosomal protein S6 [Candidatus Berkelbacteria bacterium]